MEPALTDLTTPSGRLCELLARAALDGHTAMPWTVIASAVASGGADPEAAAREAVAAGQVVAVLLGEVRAIALTEHVIAEQRVADAVGELVESQRLRVVVGRSGATGDEVAVLPDLDALGSAELADQLEATVESDVDEVVLAGDPDLLGPFSPGQPFRDVLTAVRKSSPDLVSVAPDDDVPPLLGDAVAELRRGELPTVPAEQHQLVRAGAADDAALAQRVEQLVTDSIPRVLSFRGEQIGVVTPIRSGPAGVDALHERLGDAADVRLLTDLRRQTWPALVAVWPAVAAGVLDRPSLVSMVTRGQAHVTMAYAKGLPLAQIVGLGHRRRVTILPTLLAQFLTSPDSAAVQGHNRQEPPGQEVP